VEGRQTEKSSVDPVGLKNKTFCTESQIRRPQGQRYEVDSLGYYKTSNSDVYIDHVVLLW
jgi:hypothetical protein